MGSGGTEWDATDQPEIQRLNQKTIYVGPGSGISGLATTYAGQIAVCNSTGSGFTVDTVYVRNAANSAWIEYLKTSANITESSELNSGTVAGTATAAAVKDKRYYRFYQLPTVSTSNPYRLYKITKIEWRNGDSGLAGSIKSGVDLVDTLGVTKFAATPLLAIGDPVVQDGLGALQSTNIVASNMIPAGSILGGWILCSDNTNIYEATTTSEDRDKSIVYSTAINGIDLTSWDADTDKQREITIYFKGYY